LISFYLSVFRQEDCYLRSSRGRLSSIFCRRKGQGRQGRQEGAARDSKEGGDDQQRKGSRFESLLLGLLIGVFEA